MTNTVAKPAPMNASVATSERGESRERPQTPCPLVQPPPSRVPNPTRTPAAPVRTVPRLKAFYWLVRRWLERYGALASSVQFFFLSDEGHLERLQ